MAPNVGKTLYTAALAFGIGLLIPVYTDWSVKQAQENEEQMNTSLRQAIQFLYSLDKS